VNNNVKKSSENVCFLQSENYETDLKTYLETVEVNCDTERDCNLVRPGVPFTDRSWAVVNPKFFRSK